MLQGKDFAFVHIPKCGGTALRSYLKGIEIGRTLPLGSSAPIRSPWHRIPEHRPVGKIFTILRHPAAFLRSYWLDQSPERIGVQRFLHRFWSEDLDTFVSNVAEQQPGYVTKLYRASMPWPGVRVFRLEQGLGPVLDYLGIEYDEIRTVNQSPDAPRVGLQARRLVEKSEAWAIRKWKL
jgi:hypothetical protein